MRRLPHNCAFCGAPVKPGRWACSAHSDLPALEREMRGDTRVAKPAVIAYADPSVSNNGTLLPWASSAISRELEALVAEWPDAARWPFRSRWLHDAQEALAQEFPYASSADRKLTARSIAPFPLELGPNVP